MYVMQQSRRAAGDAAGTVLKFYEKGRTYRADDFLPEILDRFLRDGAAVIRQQTEPRMISGAPENKMVGASPSNKGGPKPVVPPPGRGTIKGACPKCGRHIGRGVGFHARRCHGSSLSPSQAK